MKRIWKLIGKIWQHPQSKPFSRCYVKAQTFARRTEGSLANLEKQNLCERSVLPQLWVHFLITEIKDKVKCLPWSLGLTFGLLVKYTQLDRFFLFFKRCEIFQMGTKRLSFVVIRSYREGGKRWHFFDPHIYLGQVPEYYCWCWVLKIPFLRPQQVYIDVKVRR